MKCAMCNTFVQPKYEKVWTVNTPSGDKIPICGHCYVTTAILDKLTEIAKILRPKETKDV